MGMLVYICKLVCDCASSVFIQPKFVLFNYWYFSMIIKRGRIAKSFEAGGQVVSKEQKPMAPNAFTFCPILLS